MSHFVPDFDMDDDYALPSSSSFSPSKKSTMMEDDIMELLWQNGEVVTQSQTQRSSLPKKSTAPTSSTPSKHDHQIPDDHHHHQSTARDARGANLQEPQNHHLFMQEDEMASWLHYPLNESSFDVFCSDLLYPPPPAAAAASTGTTPTTTAAIAIASAPLPTITAFRPPVPPTARKTEPVSNFPLFSRIRERVNNNNNNNLRNPVVVRKPTVIDSRETPAACCSISRVSPAAVAGSTNIGASSGDYRGRAASTRTDTITTTTTTNREGTACDVTVTSSPGGSSASAEPPPPPHLFPASEGGQKKSAAVPEDRKRKGRDEESSEGQSEDGEFESAIVKKQVRGSTSTKRSRAAEVHNLSERRRRDRINEKMRALQELIPHCNKSDKASMLDEAIEYLKSLQLQVQMMSMGCSMVPMMFPGVQQYMPPMGMGLGVSMGMEMGMNRPVMPFPNVLAGTSLSAPAGANLGPRFPMPAFHIPHVPSSDPSRLQGVNLRDPIMLNSLGMQNNRNQLPVLNFADPYQHFLALSQMQVPTPQNQGTIHRSNGKPGTSQGADNVDNKQSGK